MAISAPPSTTQAPRERVIRVFISSTFRDMHAEREELVKRVFPELRRLCDSRGVVWNEVDLRWGVTEEQKAEGKVLPVCCRQLGNPRGLAASLVNQTLVIEKRGDLRQALAMSEESLRLAEMHGLIALTRQIQPIVTRLRSLAPHRP